MTLWVLIPLWIIGYVLVGFFSGIFFSAISRAKRPSVNEGREDDRFEVMVCQAMLWPIAFPCYLFANVGRVFGIVFCSYADLLEHVHGKTHKISGTG